MLPKTQYTRSGNLHIAYQVVGEGQIDLRLRSGLGFACRAGMGGADSR